jgi:predicted 3-demethylubiquinone-9 3-methyltransferase (glyoxalase superfamily)
VGEALRRRQDKPLRRLDDKFGISWQIIPTALGQMLNDTDRAKSSRVMKAMLQMTKIEN